MSIRIALPADDAPLTAYIVAAPCPSDTLTATLREAYGSPNEADRFADLIEALDRIELISHKI